MDKNIIKNFCADVNVVEKKYIDTLVVFENQLKMGDIIDTDIENKLNEIKEAKLEYMICALSAKKGFLNGKYIHVNDNYKNFTKKNTKNLFFLRRSENRNI